MSLEPQFDSASQLWVEGSGSWSADAKRVAREPSFVQRFKSWSKIKRAQRAEELLLYGNAPERRAPVRMALPLIAPLAVILLVVMIREPGNYTALAATGLGAVAILYGAIAAAFEARRGSSFRLQLLHCFLFSSIITAILVFYLLVEHPRAHAHWLVVFFYFLLISAAGLARDPRVAVASGVLSIIGYLSAHLVVHRAADAGVPVALATVSEFEWLESSFKVAILAGVTLTAAASAHRGLTLRWLSIADPLTGLLNRSALHTCLEIQARKAVRDARPLSIAMIDLDHFKNLNDTHGHPVGDAVLIWVAGWLRRIVRETDLVARYGGEELVVAFVDSCDERLDQRLDAWRQAVAASVLRRPDSEAEIRLTVSIGISRYPGDAPTPIDALAHADERLYEAKRLGRNRLVA